MLGSFAQLSVLIALSQTPTLQGVSPASGTSDGGRIVTLSGTNFVSGATVTFGSTDATDVTVTSSTRITARTPAGSAGAVSVTVTNPGGQFVTRPNAYTYTDLTIVSISPSVGSFQGGTPFTLTMRGLPDCTGCLVFFDTTVATGLHLIDPTTIRGVTPAHSAGDAVLTLRAPSSGTTDNIVGGFSFHVPPRVDSLDVSSGPTAGGTELNVFGANFVDGAIVRFGEASFGTITSFSSGQISVVTPEHAAGTVSVAVINPDTLTGTLVNAFTFGSAPRIDGVDPGSGPSAGGTLVTLRGANFRPGISVEFGGTPSLVASVVDQNKVIASSPPHSPGIVDVTVTNPDGQTATLPGAYNYGEVPPALVDLSPGVGPVAGGIQVTLRGSNFSAGVTVTFGGANATNVNVNSSTITATAPAHAAGQVDVVVTNSDGQSATLVAGFNYRSDRPSPMDEYVDPTTIRAKGCGAAGSSSSFFALAVVFATLLRPRGSPLFSRQSLSEKRTQRHRAWQGLALFFVLLVACSDISSQRTIPQRPTLGEQLYGVFCDRLGAQSLREDLSGSSYHLLCHRKDGLFADKVDTRFLPPVTAETQRESRAHAIARIEALARRRADVIAALDAMLPDISVSAKDLKNPDPTRSCSPAGQERFRDQLSDLLNRLQAENLYLDGTIPNSTQSMGRVFSALKTDNALQGALARLDAHQGYHPADISMGTVQSIVAYPRLRDLTNSALTLLSPDSNPYDLRAPRDPSGQRIPVPGTAYSQLTKLIEVGHHELRTATADPPVPPLVVNRDPAVERDVLNRSRSTAEMLQQLLLVEDPQLGGGEPRYIVRRDQRGVALVTLVNGVVPPPFVDQDGDGLADVDNLGRFITSDGTPAPTPFPTAGEPRGTSRDRFGRATSANGPVYDYIDTNHTFIAALLDDLKPLVNPNLADNHETLMDSLGGLQPLFGTREAAVKSYPADAREGATDVSYRRFNPENPDGGSALLELTYAAGQVLGDPAIDDTLALSRKLFAEHPNDMARLVSGLLKAKDIANRHPESTLSSRSIFWDELIDVAIRIAQAPGLLEDLLTALAADDARPFKDVLANQMKYKDLISYDRGRDDPVGSRINDPPLSYQSDSTGDVDLLTGRPFSSWFIEVDRTQPDTGTNRSFFQRYLQLIHDSHGVGACNAIDGRLFLHNVCDPLFGCGDTIHPSPASYHAQECEIYRIRDLAKFYLDSIVGEAKIVLRTTLGLQVLQSPQLFADSSGLTAFWPTPRGESLRPRPEFLNRLVFFDFRDSPDPGDNNYRTSCFISALNGPYTVAPTVGPNNECIQMQRPPHFPPPSFRGSTGTKVCGPRSFHDPACPGQFCDADPDGMIRDLGDCKDGQWLAQRDNNILFAFEEPILFPDGTTSSTYRALTPVVSAFVSNHQEELFLQLIEVLHRHWQDERGTTCSTHCTSEECNPHAPATDPYYCSQDGLVRSEPMLAEIFQTDLLDALNNLNKILINTTIQHCDEVDPLTRLCTRSTTMNGITVMANAARALIDPSHNVGLADRLGHTMTQWNDGSRIVPITPLYLLTNALRQADNTFDGAPDQKEQWRRARSQLVDQFFSVDATGQSFRFSRPGLPKVAITGIDSIRSQLLAKCPGTFTPPYTERCAWARDEIWANVRDTVTGPLFATVQDVTEALRKDTNGRVETEKLLTYLFGAGVNDSSRAALLASLADVVQLAGDQPDFIPILHALAPAVSLSTTNPDGSRRIETVDAQLTLLTRASGKALNLNNVELCSNEVDPNQVVTEVLKRATIPVSINGRVPQAPLEVYLDVIADVNRAAPDHTDKLAPADYASIYDQVADFMLSSEHGLEQFYEIVRQGTVRP